MLFQVRTSKLAGASIRILILIVAILTQPRSANAQESSFSSFPRQPFESRGANVFGTVYLDKGNQAAVKVIVNLRSLFSGMLLKVETDYGGHFEVHGIPPGAYEVSVDESGYKYTTSVVQVNTLTSEVSLHLKPAIASPPNGSAYTVSVRELKIPAKARNEYNRGLELLAKSDPLGSLSHFNKATAAFPEYYEAFYEIGIAESRLKHQDNALEAFQKSIDLSGGRFAKAQFAYGLLLSKRGESEEAERLIRTGLETDSNSPEGHLFLAISLVGQNRFDDAEKSVREALLRKPNYADAYLVLGQVYSQREDYQAEVQALDAYLRLSPTGPFGEQVSCLRETAQQHLGACSFQN